MSAQDHPDRHRRPESTRLPVRVAVLTVSDTRTAATDEGGRLITSLCEGAGLALLPGTILRDEPAQVAAHVTALVAEERPDAILITGGTGISRRDTTVEALAARFDKTLDGFGELFRMLSFSEVGPAAMLSRATAGTMGRTVIFLMPGSPKAVALAMSRLILPVLGHLVAQLADVPDGKHDEQSGRPHRQP